MRVEEGQLRERDSQRVEGEVSTPGTVSPGSRVCTYRKGGVCDVHGPGAKYHWRPIKKEDQVPGPDGKLKTRHYFWVCKLGPKGRGMLRQMKCRGIVQRVRAWMIAGIMIQRIPRIQGVTRLLQHW